MVTGQFVSYLRRRDVQNYNPDIQRDAVDSHLAGWSAISGITARLVGEYTEHEQGTHADRHRPELMKALTQCLEVNAILIIAQMGNLMRNALFLQRLTDSNVRVMAAGVPSLDHPDNSRALLEGAHQLAVIESERFGDRMKSALADSKKRGVALGNPNVHLAYPLGIAKNQSLANQFSAGLGPVFDELEALGIVTLEGTAQALNARGLVTRSGKPWQTSTVKNTRTRWRRIKSGEIDM